jgi:hypothetical protein
MLLRHRETEYRVVEGLRIDLAPGEFLARDVRRELQAVEAGEAALPTGEGRAPVGTVGNFGVVVHGGS